MQRHPGPERMDVLPLSPSDTQRIARDLAWINRRLGGDRLFLNYFEREALHWPADARIRIVDIGCGAADLLGRLGDWARHRGWAVDLIGLEPHPGLAALARTRSGVAIEEIPFQNFSPSDGSVDYVISSLTLHHLSDEDVIALLRRARLWARRGIFLVDLERSARAAAWIWGLSRLLQMHPIVRHDGPLSVRRAFKPWELRHLATESGTVDASVRRHFGYRLSLEWAAARASSGTNESPTLVRRRAVVHGGGPAGTAAAIALARQGWSVELFEKKSFPRAKLCGGYLSGPAVAELGRLGVFDSVRAAAHPIQRILLYSASGRRAETRLSTPSFSVDRSTLDELLLREAARLGVQCRLETEAPASVAGVWTLVATGRRSLLQGERWFGLQAEFSGMDRISDQVELDLTSCGYVGLARRPGGVHVCLLVTADLLKRFGPEADHVLAQLAGGHRRLKRHLDHGQRESGWMAVGPVHMGLRQLAAERQLFVGDAACVVDPFAGEGMAHALISAGLAAEALETDDPARAYRAAWQRRFRAPLQWQRAARVAMRYPSIQPLLFGAIRTAPSLLRKISLLEPQGCRVGDRPGSGPGLTPGVS